MSNTIINDFLDNRAPEDYCEVIDDLFFNYVSTEEYTTLSFEERQKIVACYKELKLFINRIIETKNIN